MHYDFVDIGTSDFDYSIPSLNSKTLLVEPLLCYLNSILESQNQTKANYAISNYIGEGKIYYIDPTDIKKYDFPNYLRGCNSFNAPHITVLRELEKYNLLHLYKTQNISVITVEKLLELYNIDSIDQLKIDTEGHDHIILEEFYKAVSNNFSIQTIKFEYYENNTFNNKQQLDDLIEKFKQLNYSLSNLGPYDKILTVN